MAAMERRSRLARAWAQPYRQSNGSGARSECVADRARAVGGASAARPVPEPVRSDMPAPTEIERLLTKARSSEREALDALLPLVYDELRALAHHQLQRFRPGETLSTTALVHEAYLKLVDQTRATFHDRRHFFTVAAMAMRQIIVDYARRRAAQKRGGGAHHEPLDALDSAALSIDAQAAALVDLDEALGRLSALDERPARVVELRFFGGLSVDETADVLEVSTATVKRDSRVARAFLARQLGEAHAH